MLVEINYRYFFQDLCWWKLITERKNENAHPHPPPIEKKTINRSIWIIGRGQRFWKKKYRPITRKLRYLSKPHLTEIWNHFTEIGYNLTSTYRNRKHSNLILLSEIRYHLTSPYWDRKHSNLTLLRYDNIKRVLYEGWNLLTYLAELRYLGLFSVFSSLVLIGLFYFSHLKRNIDRMF